MGFTKWDAGKAPLYELSVYPRSVLEDEASVLALGAAKYGRANWRNAEPDEGVERYLAAALRHILAMMDGELFDPESGKPHTAHVRCCMGFLHHYLAKADFVWGPDDAASPSTPKPT